MPVWVSSWWSSFLPGAQRVKYRTIPLTFIANLSSKSLHSTSMYLSQVFSIKKCLTPLIVLILPTLSNTEYLSKPDITFKVVKDAVGNFNAHVTCQVTHGSPPINFTINGSGHVINSEHQNASFIVPIVLDQDMGTVYCRANNGKKTEQSRPMNLTVGM